MDEVFAERAELTELVELRDNFSNGSLNPKRYGVDPSEKFDYRLRLRVNTIGTKDDTMKFHGVRSVEKVNLRLQIPRHILD